MNRRTMGQAVYKCGLHPRKKVFALVLTFSLLTLLAMILYTARSHLLREDVLMEEQLAIINTRIQFLETQYREKLEDIINSQDKSMRNVNITSQHGFQTSTYSPEVVALLQNISGSRAAEATHALAASPESIKTPFSYQLLPHLLEHTQSLRLAYHMHGGRSYADVVIGIPTVKRDKESYLIYTIGKLIEGLDKKYLNTTLIVVNVGETRLDYVITVARSLELTYPQHVESGLIEVIAPDPSYYPDFNKIPLSLGDSRKRVTWRTKQNLDTMFLMAFAKDKGMYYLMMEDDVNTNAGYMGEILKFAAAATAARTDTEPWFFINFSTIGGIGKLFKTADMTSFITYVELFYINMPIDWLLESYLANRICGIDMTTKACGEAKHKIRPTFKPSLFSHIGLFSSLKGKIQKVKDKRFGSLPAFFPHKNPPLHRVYCTMTETDGHSIKDAYLGTTYFWGLRPVKGQYFEFWFQEPLEIERYLFRSGNLDHPLDKFSNTVIEVMPAGPTGNYTEVGVFDEFGLAEGEISSAYHPIVSMRVRVQEDQKYWVLVNEIELTVKPANDS